MVIPRTFLETQLRRTRGGWRVDYHVRPRKSIFTNAKSKLFPTEGEARAWMSATWAEGVSGVNHRGQRRFTTNSVLWVREDLMPTAQYSGLPELRSARTDRGITLWLDGQTVVADCQTGAELKRRILDHPKGECLCAQPCARCGRMPRIGLLAGTLSHSHEDCPIAVFMPEDRLTPPPMQIALWNRYFRIRKRPTKLEPMTRPHFMILGALREPTERDMTRKIRAIEVIE